MISLSSEAVSYGWVFALIVVLVFDNTRVQGFTFGAPCIGSRDPSKIL